VVGEGYIKGLPNLTPEVTRGIERTKGLTKERWTGKRINARGAIVFSRFTSGLKDRGNREPTCKHHRKPKGKKL